MYSCLPTSPNSSDQTTFGTEWITGLSGAERLTENLDNIQGVHKKGPIAPFWGFYEVHPDHNLWAFDYLRQGSQTFIPINM